MSDISEKCSSQFPGAQGDIFKFVTHINVLIRMKTLFLLNISMFALSL